MATTTTAASGFNGAYLVAMVGAWVWFWQQHTGLWGHLLGFLEGVVWPGFVVYDVLRALR